MSLHSTFPTTGKKAIHGFANARHDKHSFQVAYALKALERGNRDIARIANAVPITLYSRVSMNVEIVVLNCQKCNQCLKGHKSLGSLFEGVL